MKLDRNDMLSLLASCAQKARLELLTDEQAAEVTFAQISDMLPIYEDVYGQLCDILEPYVKREGINPNGKLPASVVDSVQILLGFWVDNN